MVKRLKLFSALVFCSVSLFAQAPGNGSEKDDRNVMLNAEAANKPREINIGLNSEDYGTIVVEDGLLSSFIDYPLYSYYHWAGGNSYSSSSLFSLEETALGYAHMGFALDSRTASGTDKFAGAVTLATSSDLLLKMDANINGPISARQGLYFTAGAYVNKDPTSTHPSFCRYVNDAQIFKLGLTKKWRSGELSIFYKLSLSKGLPSNAFSAPFYYDGKGGITPLENFRLGRDNYLPEDDGFEYMDVETGQMKSTRFREMGRKRFHDVVARYSCVFGRGWNLEAGAHMLYAGMYDHASFFTSSIKDNAQHRNVSLYSCDYLDVMGDVKVRREFDRHSLVLGLNEIFLDHRFVQSSASLAHTVGVDPDRVANDSGEMTWGFNTSGKFYDGISGCTALYAKDVWHIHPKVTLDYGLRGALTDFSVDAAVNEEGETINSRTAGFNLTNARVRNYRRIKPTVCALGKLDWNITDKLFLTAEEIFVQNPRQMCHFSSATMPSDKLVNTSLTRGGLSWNNDWLDLASMVSYISKSNLNSSGNASKEVAGQTETASYLAFYTIGTLGWTTDMNLHRSFKGHSLALHFLCTYQEPKYSSYKAAPVFSDGEMELDFSGKYVPQTSRVLFEIDPSCSMNRIRVWLSARYYSRQYANKVNNVYFNGHWETFGGIGYNHKCFSVDAKLTNILGQSGAKGSIAAADTITDVSILDNYLLAGSYIIPFSATLSLTVRL